MSASLSYNYYLMHHFCLCSAMKSSKVREDGNPLPRPRSASTSENSNPLSSRRPVGVVAPQMLPSASGGTLSNSRERCDSLPTRPKTLIENPHDCVFRWVNWSGFNNLIQLKKNLYLFYNIFLVCRSKQLYIFINQLKNITNDSLLSEKYKHHNVSEHTQIVCVKLVLCRK